MYHPEKKFIFIHPPKCAGTSLRLVLREAFNSCNKNINFEPFYMDLTDEGIDYIMPIHGSISKFIKFICDRHGLGFFKREEWYIFSVVRNPYDRLVSYYHHSQVNNPNFVNGKTFKQFIETIISINEKSQNWSFYDLFHHKTKLFLDDYVRLENFEEDVKRITNKLGIEDYKIHHYKPKSNRINYDYRSYYNDKMIDFVSKKLKWDIEYFNYKF